jgi:flagellar hook-associated protein 2
MASIVNFTGLASGIDSNALIEALLEQKRSSRIRPLQEKNSALEETNSAFSDLKTKLNALKDLADNFRLVNGGGLAKLAASSNESAVGVSASNAASNGSYSVTVSQLAKNGSISFNDRFSASNATINSAINNGAVAADRTVTYTIGTGGTAETIAIELTSSSTLSDLVTSFNEQSSNAEASVINVGTSSAPSYALVINSLNSGTELGSVAASVGSEITSAGSGAFSASTTSQATNASFSVSGISGTLTRSSNAINDVISGLTLNLQGTGSSTLTVSDDADASAENVQELVDAYNEVLTFIRENDLVSREEDGQEVSNIFGPLASTSLDENVISALRGAFSNSGTTGGLINILADLGVTTQRDGSLSFDVDTFKEALSQDAGSVNTIMQNLGESLAAVDGTIAQFTRFNGLIDQSVTSNQNEIRGNESRIGDLEKALAREEESLIKRFSRLEGLIGQLNSQQNALSSLLPS